MTDTVTVPTRMLSLAEWDALGDGDDVRNLEIVEGMLCVAPSPSGRHQLAAAGLAVLLNRQLPRDLVAVPDTDVLLQAEPPTVRAPDVMIVPQSVFETKPRFAAADAVLVVEFVSPGSRRTDRITKRAEYEDAAIPHYWVIELDASGDERFVAHELVDGRYAEVLRTSDAVELGRPHPLSFTLDELTRRG